jgi:gluconate 2-dehydrogenase gamma chain
MPETKPDNKSDSKPDTKLGRREFLTGAGVVGAASVQALTAIPADAQTVGHDPAAQAVPEPAGYTYLKPSEAAFVEAIVDHMIPKDELTGSGTELGIATYIDRALAGSWGKGARLYKDGPWQRGTPNQGYQLPLTPAELYRSAIEGSNAYCRKNFGKDFDCCTADQKETFLKDLAAGKITLEGGLPGRAFFVVLYDNVMEGLFADPIYGGNKDKAGWKMVGFPGVLANNAENVKKYSDGKKFTADPVSIADMS